MPKPKSSFAEDFKQLALEVAQDNEDHLKLIAKERRALYRKLRALNTAEVMALHALQTLAPYTTEQAA